MNYFITGLTGNFGTHLNDLFVEGDTIYTVSTRDAPDDLDDLPYKVEWIKADLSDTQAAIAAITAAVDDTQIDTVILAAAKFGNPPPALEDMMAVTQTQLDVLEELHYSAKSKIITIGSTFEVSENPDLSGQPFGTLSAEETASKKDAASINYAKSKGLLLDGAMTFAQNHADIKCLHLTLGYMGMGEEYKTTLVDGLQSAFQHADTKNYEGMVSPAEQVVPLIEEFINDGWVDFKQMQKEQIYIFSQSNFTRAIAPGNLDAGSFRISPEDGLFYLEQSP